MTATRVQEAHFASMTVWVCWERRGGGKREKRSRRGHNILPGILAADNSWVAAMVRAWAAVVASTARRRDTEAKSDVTRDVSGEGGDDGDAADRDPAPCRSGRGIRRQNPPAAHHGQ